MLRSTHFRDMRTPFMPGYTTQSPSLMPFTRSGSEPGRRRGAPLVQQDTLGRRRHKHDPLGKIRGLLRHGVEHLTERQQTRITACLNACYPTDEVNLTWQCYQCAPCRQAQAEAGKAERRARV